jgi:hypothetical protein
VGDGVEQRIEFVDLLDDMIWVVRGWVGSIEALVEQIWTLEVALEHHRVILVFFTAGGGVSND